MAATDVANQNFIPKVHESQGGNELIAESGGFITALSGSRVTIQSGAVLDVKGTITRLSQQSTINTGAKVGTTSGWAVAAADDIGLQATLPASQTSSTLVIPVPGLKVGDIITAFSVVGQIESAGGAVTLDANLRKHTAAASEVTDVSVGSITQISVTADAVVSAEKTGLSETVAADETFYVLLTGTTAAVTDIALQGITITVTEK